MKAGDCYDLHFDLQDVYRAVDYIASLSGKLQKHLNDKIRELIGRDLSYILWFV